MGKAQIIIWLLILPINHNLLIISSLFKLEVIIIHISFQMNSKIMKLFKWGLLAISLIITHPTWIQIIIIQAMATNNLKIIMLQGKIRSKLGLNITNSK